MKVLGVQGLGSGISLLIKGLGYGIPGLCFSCLFPSRGVAGWMCEREDAFEAHTRAVKWEP